MHGVPQPKVRKLTEALQHMQAALDVLDQTGAPTDIGSHLDLAICRLELALGAGCRDRNVHQLRRQITERLAAEIQDPPDRRLLIWDNSL